METGISIITLTQNGAQHLDRLLSTFVQTNTYAPVEWIIIDHNSTDDTDVVVEKYALNTFIRKIKRARNHSFSASCNYGASKARYPYLLFINNDILYTADVLPKAVAILDQSPIIGAVGVRLDDMHPLSDHKVSVNGYPLSGKKDPDNREPLTDNSGKVPAIQHLGIEFIWNEARGYYHPRQIRHPNLKRYLQSCRVSSANTAPSPYAREPITNNPQPAVTAAFLLCRKIDFDALHGYSEEYQYGLEDIDFCLRLGRDLKKSCHCITDMGLQHVEGATRKMGDRQARNETIERNHRIFKAKWDSYIRDLIGQSPAQPIPGPTPSPQQVTDTRQPTADTPKPTIPPTPPLIADTPITYSRSPEHQPRPLNILFVLYNAIDSNGGLHAQLHGARLMAEGAECLFAVPKESPPASPSPYSSLLTPHSDHVFPFSSLLAPHSSLPFKDGRGPDIIHAWTPREVVRKFCEKMLKKYPCPLVIHLEDNEEYLTEVTLGRPFAELAALPEKELDSLIPPRRYHPLKGRQFLSSAQGLTMIIDTLGRFNLKNVPGLVLPPPVDERLFYPRPLNLALRKELGIPEDHVVLAYTGNVHAGNREEVRELYLAVHRLNEQGCPAVLIRTGINAEALGDEAWITAYEKNLGWVERNKVPDILAVANVLVQPGTPGPFNDQRIPSKLPEYFAIGRPVILPRTNLGLKVAHGLEGYVLDKTDGESIARAVLEISRDKKMAGRLAMGAAGFYRSELSVIEVKTLMSFYTTNLSI